MKKIYLHFLMVVLPCTFLVKSKCATCTVFDRTERKGVVLFDGKEYCSWEEIRQSVAIKCGRSGWPLNMQVSDCLLVQTNVMAIVGSHNVRNIYYLDGGEPSDSTADPDSDQEYRYKPIKILYAEPLVIEKGTPIGSDCLGTNYWGAPLSHGRYYLSGVYRYFGDPPVPSFYPPVGPFTEFLSGDYYVGLRLAIGDNIYFGWSQAARLSGQDILMRPWVYNPEPGASIRAGMEAVPATKVRYLDRSVEISWHPVWAEKWKLEASPSLATNAIWSAVTSVVSNRVEMATLGSQRFFRLRKSEP